MRDFREKCERVCRELPALSYLKLWFQRGNKARVCVKDKSGNVRVQVPVTIGALFLMVSPLLMGVLGAFAWGLECSLDIDANA